MSRNLFAAHALTILALVVFGSSLHLASAQPAPGAAPPPPEVTVMKLSTERVTVFEEYVGQTDAADTVEIRARVNGLLERQIVADGAYVRRGQLLFALDREPFATALVQARAQLAQAEAQLANSTLNLNRSRPLAAEQALSQQELDSWVTRERSDRATVDLVRAQVRTAELNVSYTQIQAPRDGFLSRGLVRPGGVVSQATTLLATLYSSDPMYVNFTVPEGRAFDFQKRLAQTGKAALPFAVLLPDGTTYSQAPKLSYVDPTVDTKNGTMQIRLSLANPQRDLKPGLLVKVKVPAYENDNAVRIPGRAVTEILGRRSVYIVAADGKFEARDMVGARRAGQDWIVEKGFQPGEMVIVEGIGKIRPGLTQVKPMPPRPPGGGGGPGAGKPPADKPPAGKPPAEAAPKG
jgi:membrane fusion protein, multidrug efflux system